MKKLYFFLSLLFCAMASTGFSQAHVVINQVYGGGGNANATYTHDFIELYNPTNATVSLSGWSVNYASASGTSWQKTTLSGSIPSHGFFLIEEAAGTGTFAPLPTPDFTNGSINMSGTTGKVILQSS